MRRFPLPSSALFTAALLFAGCAAGTQSRREAPSEEAAAVAPAPVEPSTPPPAQPFDPRSYAAAFPGSLECEQAARQVRDRSPDAAWSVLRICLERGGFTSLRRLTDGFWDRDLQSRPEAARLLAKVIAHRGGDVDGDVAALVQRRIPLFSLGAAVAQPATYQGRLVLMRAKVEGFRELAGKSTVLLAEQSLGSRTLDVQVGAARQATREKTGQLNVELTNTRLGDGSLQADSARSATRRRTITEQRHENTIHETGVEALGRLEKPDPFLEPNRQFVILARFEGVRPTSAQASEDGEPESIPVVSILGYFEPAALLIE